MLGCLCNGYRLKMDQGSSQKSPSLEYFCDQIARIPSAVYCGIGHMSSLGVAIAAI